jgi:hypothetical protein
MDVDSDLWGSVNTIVSHRGDDDDDDDDEDDDDNDDVDYYDTNVMTGGGIGEGDNIGAMPLPPSSWCASIPPAVSASQEGDRLLHDGGVGDVRQTECRSMYEVRYEKALLARKFCLLSCM